MKTYIGLILYIIALGCFLFSGAIWFFRPELTQMQLFFEYWYVAVIGLGSLILGQVLLHD